MKVSVLASGSKGNVSYLETEKTKILVDVGMNCLYIETKLKKLGINPKEIDAIVLTHTHVDHINGLRVFYKKYKPKVYLTDKMLKDICEIDNYELIEDDFSINDLKVEVIKTSHDASDSNGYIFSSDSKSVVYITDTGYINKRYSKKLENKNVYIIESNHDVEMLQNGKYPYHLKQRILSDSGHLSNDMTSKYLLSYIGSNTKDIILIHLSHENNTKELAYDTLKNTLKNKMPNVLVSEQNDNTEMIEI